MKADAAAASHPHLYVGIEHAGGIRARLHDEEAAPPGPILGGIHVIDPDPAAASSLDPHPRVRVHAGPDALQAFVRDRGSRLDAPLPRGVHQSRRLASLSTATVGALRQLAQLQKIQTQKVNAALAARAAGRDARWWASRWSDIAAGTPARVLLITSRHTTYLRHAATDLCQALADAGHAAELVLEADDRAAMLPLRTLRAAERLDPDLTVVPNLTRHLYAAFLPPGVPHAAWVQDAMPRLYAVGDPRPGPRDFWAGHRLPGSALLDAHGDANRVEWPVPVSTRKFRPVPEAALGPHRCDLLYVSHQSEPVEALHHRLVEAAPAEARDAVRACLPAVREAVALWPRRPAFYELFEAAAAISGVQDPAHPRTQRLHETVIQPLADRLLRHESLDWAAKLAAREGLSLRIHGVGWEAHPRLARFAAGPLRHGRHLREAYAGAAITLHASASGAGHQRIAECALSGGLPLARRCWNEAFLDNTRRVARLVRRLPPDACLPGSRCPAWRPEQHPELAALLNLRERMPADTSPLYADWDHHRHDPLYAQPLDASHAFLTDPGPPPRVGPLLLADGPFGSLFSTPDELATLVLGFVREPQRRRAASARLSRLAREHKSVDSFARDLVSLVAERMIPPALEVLADHLPPAADVASGPPPAGTEALPAAEAGEASRMLARCGSPA